MTLNAFLLLGEGGTVESTVDDNGGRKTVVRGRRFVAVPALEAGDGEVRFEGCLFQGSGVSGKSAAPPRPEVMIRACLFHQPQPAS